MIIENISLSDFNIISQTAEYTAFNKGYSTAVTQYHTLSFALFGLILAQFIIRIAIARLNKREDVKYVKIIQALREIDRGLLLPELAVAVCFLYYALGFNALVM